MMIKLEREGIFSPMKFRNIFRGIMGLSGFLTASIEMALIMMISLVVEYMVATKKPQVMRYALVFLVATPILMYINANYS